LWANKIVVGTINISLLLTDGLIEQRIHHTGRARKPVMSDRNTIFIHIVITINIVVVRQAVRVQLATVAITIIQNGSGIGQLIIYIWDTRPVTGGATGQAGGQGLAGGTLQTAIKLIHGRLR
jgi:hypothetical protein